jgi:NAD(P)-dependent dehydrogenase (short-subunit alcohol dehydrogenase family)
MALVTKFAVRSLGAISTIALEPTIPAAVLVAMKYAPADLLGQLLNRFPVDSSAEGDTMKPVLHILLALGVVRRLNQFLNFCALNNWRASAHQGWEWHREVAVVTGGCSGIGKAIVLGLAKEGVRVAVLDVHDLPDDLKAIDGIAYFKCDLTSAFAVTEAGNAVRKTLGHPSILVNNAGIAHSHEIIRTTDESLRKIFGVNLLALWSTSRDFLPHMILRNKGHVVTIASLASFVALPTAADYSATKAGALAFHESLTCEIKHVYKAPGIITTVVHPSWVRTNMTKEHTDKIERGQGKITLTPDDIASPVLKHIFGRMGGQLIVPSQMSSVSGIRGWPNWVQELVRDGIGRAS